MQAQYSKRSVEKMINNKLDLLKEQKRPNKQLIKYLKLVEDMCRDCEDDFVVLDHTDVEKLDDN